MAFLTDEVVDRLAVRARFKRVYCAAETVVVIPSGCYLNLCLREVYEEAGGIAGPNDRVWFQIAPGAEIGSRSTKLPALRRGWWPGEHYQPRSGAPRAPLDRKESVLAVEAGLRWR